MDMEQTEQKIMEFTDELVQRYPALRSCRQELIDAYEIMKNCYQKDGKLLIAGNGGSAADCEHMAGELMKRFRIPRPIKRDLAQKLVEIDCVRGKKLSKNLERNLMAIPLVAHEALTTAYLNDVDGEGVFAQQLMGYGREGDVFLGISTSGNSENILCAAIVAKALGMQVIGLTGKTGGKFKNFCDVTVQVPETETYLIQELHLPVYHCWCQMLEEYFFGKSEEDEKAAVVEY